MFVSIATLPGVLLTLRFSSSTHHLSSPDKTKKQDTTHKHTHTHIYTHIHTQIHTQRDLTYIETQIDTHIHVHIHESMLS